MVEKAGLQNCTLPFGGACGPGQPAGQPLGRKTQLPRGPLFEQGPKKLARGDSSECLRGRGGGSGLLLAGFCETAVRVLAICLCALG